MRIGPIKGAHTYRASDIVRGVHPRVQKRGTAPRGRTFGYVISVDTDGVVAFGTFDRHYRHALEIKWADDVPGQDASVFSERGDSGSAIVNNEREVVGILFAGEGSATAKATPIQPILDAFHLVLETADAPGIVKTVPEIPGHAMVATELEPLFVGRLRHVETEVAATPAGRDYVDVVRRHLDEAQRLSQRQSSRRRDLETQRRSRAGAGTRLVRDVAGSPTAGADQRSTARGVSQHSPADFRALRKRQLGERLRAARAAAVTTPRASPIRSSSQRSRHRVIALAAGTLETLAKHLGLALQPLGERLDPANVLQTFASLGLRFSASVAGASGVQRRARQRAIGGRRAAGGRHAAIGKDRRRRRGRNYFCGRARPQSDCVDDDLARRAGRRASDRRPAARASPQVRSTPSPRRCPGGSSAPRSPAISATGRAPSSASARSSD